MAVVATEPTVEATSSIVRASAWTVGQQPAEVYGLDERPEDAVLWVDAVSEADPSEVLALLAPLCKGLQLEMLVDLLDPDPIPRGRRWEDERIRLASTFAVYGPEDSSDGSTPPSLAPSSEATFQPIELLAGDRWLITCWHEAVTYRGSLKVSTSPALDHRAIHDAVAMRWMDGRARNGGDLGVLVMNELAYTYAPAHRRIRSALEEWELRLYDEESEESTPHAEPEELRDLWGARARLRDWLSPLNLPGLKSDINKAWLPVTDHDEVKTVDDRVDKALKSLGELGEPLRSGFHLLHIDASERKQNRLEFIAAVFLIPTFIVGFYGANTWLPGKDHEAGFWVMLAALVLMTATAVAVLTALHNERSRLRRLIRRNSVTPVRPE